MSIFDKVFRGKKEAAAGAKPGQTLAKDPVCGMDVDVNQAPAKSEYQGQTYYFCAPGCKKTFDKNPEKYLSGPAPQGHGHGGGAPGCCG